MANLGDLAGLVFKTVAQNTGKIASTVNNVVDTVKKTATADAIKAKYQPGQSFSAADNTAMQNTSSVAKYPNTSLRMPQRGDFSEPPAMPLIRATGDYATKTFDSITKAGNKTAETFKNALNPIAQTAGEKLSQAGEELNKRVEARLANEDPNSAFSKFMRIGQGVVGSPLAQAGEGLKGLASNNAGENVKGLESTVFGLLGATPAGIAFNAVISHPDVKPLAEKVFGAIDETKKFVDQLPVVKDLPDSARAGIGVGIDMIIPLLLHKAIKAPFKTTKIMEMAHPVTGEMMKVAVPVDTAGWKQFKADVVDQVQQLKTDPIGFLKKQQIGMSIKDVSGEVPKKKVSAEMVNSEPGSNVVGELANSFAGDRYGLDYGIDKTQVSYHSTFPDWIPKDLRKTPLLKAVQEHLLNDTVPKYKKQLELYNIVKDKIEAEYKANPPEPGKMTVSQAEAIADSGFNDSRAAKLNADIAKKQADLLAENMKKQEQNSLVNEQAQQLQQSQKTKLGQAWGEKFAPFKNMGEQVANAWKDRLRAFATGNERANTEFHKLNNDAIVRPEYTKQIRTDYENGVPTPMSEQIKATADRFREEAINRGVPVEERQNYMPHYYAQDRAQVIEAMTKMLKEKGMEDAMIRDYLDGQKLPQNVSNRLKLSPGFDQERAFRTYADAEKYGLTPKYQSVAQDFAHWINTLEQTIANRKFIETLKEQGHLTTEQKPGYKPLETPFSKGEQLYAVPKLVKTFNDYFRDEDNLGWFQVGAKAMAKANKVGTDVLLSAGIPGTSFNFFTYTQLNKEATALNGKVFGNVVASNFDKTTRQYFLDHQESISELAGLDKPISLSYRTGNWDTFFPQNSGKTGIWKAVDSSGKFFHNMFNKKTFDNFMPRQTVSIYEGARDAFLKAGIARPEAIAKAGELTRTWAAIPEDWGRGKTTQDAINGLVMASRFRESVVNLIGNTIKSVTTEIKNPAFKVNRRFLAGVTATFVAYNLLNKQLTGKFMVENGNGHELQLAIPDPTVEGGIVYVPFMFGLTSFPRSMISAATSFAAGDMKEAAQNLSNLNSIPLQAGTQIINNKDYYGKQIWTDGAGLIQNGLEVGKYLGLNYNHPYVKALVENFTTPEAQKKPALQILSTLLELPLKFGSMSKNDKAEFFDMVDKQKARDTKMREEVKVLYDNLQVMKANGEEEQAKALLNELSDEEYAVYKTIKSNIKAQATKSAKVETFSEYKTIRKLKEAGDLVEAMARVNAMDDAEYKAYSSLKKQFDGTLLQ